MSHGEVATAADRIRSVTMETYRKCCSSSFLVAPLLSFNDIADSYMCQVVLAVTSTA